MFRIFSRFQKKPDVLTEEPDKPLSEFQRAARFRCEVRAMDDRPVFLADVKDYNGDSLFLRPAFGAEAPPVIFNSTYKLVFRTPFRPAPAWSARVRGSSTDFWKMDELIRQPDEQRTSFRQCVRLSATVHGLLKLPEKGGTLSGDCFSDESAACEVVDVGMGGMQLCSSEPFFKSELVAVTDLFLSDDPQPFTLPLQVRWVADSEDGHYHFGCAFHAVPEHEEQRLCAAMFGLQRAYLVHSNT